MSELNVSLEPHLLDVLETLPPLLPAQLADQLRPYLHTPLNPANNPRTIPYALLLSLSQWSRTPQGLACLTIQTPKLDPQSYSMIALLAGTTTSPERRFPKYVLKEDEEQVARNRAASDRKTLTALVNALLSVAGSGVATWWAAERLSWRNEWRVLLSLFAATVVAVSEAVLYIIWESRKSGRLARNEQRLQALAAQLKKDKGSVDETAPEAVMDIPKAGYSQVHAGLGSLRHRATATGVGANE